MSSYNSVVRGLTGGETTTEEAMGVASPEIKRVREDAFSEFVLHRVNNKPRSEPVPPLLAFLHAFGRHQPVRKCHHRLDPS